MVAPKTPNRGIEPRKPVTSPRAVRTVRHMFNTPQAHRVKSLHLTTTMESPKIDNSVSVLHRVRENNIKKHKQQKVIKRGHIFDDDDDDDDDEESEEDIPLVVSNLTCVYIYLGGKLNLDYLNLEATTPKEAFSSEWNTTTIR